MPRPRRTRCSMLLFCASQAIISNLILWVKNVNNHICLGDIWSIEVEALHFFLLRIAETVHLPLVPPEAELENESLLCIWYLTEVRCLLSTKETGLIRQMEPSKSGVLVGDQLQSNSWWNQSKNHTTKLVSHWEKRVAVPHTCQSHSPMSVLAKGHLW